MIEKFEKVANDCKMEMDYSLGNLFEWGRTGAGVRKNRGWDGIRRGERGWEF